MCEEYRSCCEIEARAVEIERIAGRNHQPDHAFFAAGILKLCDHARQHCFRGCRGKYNQEFFPDVANELKEAETAPVGNWPKDTKHEDEACQIEADQQLSEREQGSGAEPANGECDRAERSEWRRPHDHSYYAKQHLRTCFDEIVNGFAGLSHPAQRKSAQDRDVEDLKYISFAKGADEGVWNDVEQKLLGRLFMSLLDIGRHARCVDVRQVDIHSDPRLEQIDRNESNDQSNGGQHLEVSFRAQQCRR